VNTVITEKELDLAMTSKAILFAVLALASPAAAQNSADGNVYRVLHFNSTDSVQDFQEIGVVVSKIADIQQATVDTPEKALVLHATTAQIALAEWLLTELDKPVGVQALQSQKHEYQVSNSGDDVVRVFYLSHTETMQRLQEIATVVRSVGDIRRLFAYNSLRAVAMRGTPDQAALVEFLFNEIDKPAIGPDTSQRSASSATYIYRPGGADSVLKVFYLPNTKTVQDFHELATTVGMLTNTRRMFTYNAPRAVAARGTAEQIEVADWLFNELDNPPNPQEATRQAKGAGRLEYRPIGTSDDVVRVYYLRHAQTAQRLQEIAMEAQALLTRKRTALPYNPAQAVIVRGTSAEIALADRLITERDRP
jgi:hypothetical protein